jgi:hypothetical protein
VFINKKIFGGSKERSYPFLMICFCTLMMNMGASVLGQKVVVPKPLPPISEGKGRLVYNPDALGNRIPDFSYCGYKASNNAIPNGLVKVVVPVAAGDATLRIQSAIDYVASLPTDADGFKGAVLLQKGTYNVEGQLKISSSGVILRGSGMGAGGTVLLGTGKDRATLVRIFGKNDKTTGTEVKVADVYVPVNATKLTVSNASFKVGDDVIIHRPSTKKWIADLGTETFGGGLSALEIPSPLMHL